MNETLSCQQKLDIAADVETVKQKIDSSDDVSNFELEINRLKLSTHKRVLEQEEEKLSRLRKNNDRRPILFWLVFCVIVGFYFVFAICVLNNPNPNDFTLLQDKEKVKGITTYFTVIMILLSVIPTVLLIVLIKAVFSPQEKNQKELLDSIPVVTVAKGLLDK